VPPTYDARTPSPLAVMLHGAGATADQGIDLLRPYADDRRLVILAPKSASGTWDLITSSGFGRDAQALDALLDKEVFPKVAVDARHVAVGGFSDGASYALSLGITNGGHLFTHVLAFSPGFMCPSTQADHPSIFIAHGLSDAVLPITNCSQRLVPALREAGFPLTYVEFAGAHTVPSNVVEKALAWFLGEG
jgi:predicted esterase